MDEALNILWTGGWDSTFRVLYAVIVEKREVRPHYIINYKRKSSLKEMQAMSEIREKIKRFDSDAFERILPLRIVSLSDIPEDESIAAALERLRKKAPLGSQYDWLARYAQREKIERLELSVHVDDKAYFFLKDKVEKDNNQSWRLRADVLGDERIFSLFSFPLLQTTKREMKDQAERYGFLEILDISWFCHSPKNGLPCGICNPCVYSIEEGMEYRFPKSALFSYKTRGIREIVRAPFKVFRRLAFRKLSA